MTAVMVVTIVVVVLLIAAGVVLSNFITPLVLILVTSIPEKLGVGIAFGLGYGVFRFCRFHRSRGSQACLCRY